MVRTGGGATLGMIAYKVRYVNGNKGGKWKMEIGRAEEGGEGGLIFSFAPGQEAGGYGGGEGGAPDPGEADVELAEARIQIDRNAHAVANGVGMSGRGEIGRKMVDAPSQNWPNAHDGEKKHESEHKEHVAHRNHL